MIIFRVTTGRSFTKFSLVKDDVVTNSIQFARQTAESSLIQSTLNCDADTEQGLTASIGEPTQARVSIIHIAQEGQSDSGDVEKVSVLIYWFL
ncbi:hypothetical protein EST38_g1475 [Candolleomyces aberdarensis]|uniref:Uncharacterized protein n=1 Tax=Candolleomyces aberdarensis TaxID=2316362 RepID=A0A4Q2DUT7_9AGAR|nr:hypothetical protein EST38_g1475 [Candolleomyces aberdarensis]